MKTDAEFLSDLSKSRQTVNNFANIQRSKNVQIWLPPEQTRPDSSQRMKFVDSGDLMLQMRIEHKSISLEFTCREDFPNESIIVDEQYKYDSKNSTPVLMYVLQSANKTHAAIVYGYTKKRWHTKEIFDKRQNRSCTMYMCDKRYIRFCKIEDIF
jgi:hypothetical protein